MSPVTSTLHRTSTHWGAYDAEVAGGAVVALHPIAGDPDPSPIGDSLVDALTHPNRIARPMVRKGWLENGPAGPKGGRGREPFVAVSWPRALDLAATELDRVRREFGNPSIYAGSYGWSSAGRFHHAQSQVHRFMNAIGGYSYSVDTYSVAAAQVILPHVIGSVAGLSSGHTVWPVIAGHSDLVVKFGGIPLKNAQVNHGGIGRHDVRGWLRRCRENGVDFVNIGPNRADADPALEAEWDRAQAQHRHRADARHRPHAGRRGPPRRGLPGALHDRLRPVPALPHGRGRRRAQGCRMGGRDHRHRGRRHPRAGAPHGGRAHHADHGVVAATR